MGRKQIDIDVNGDIAAQLKARLVAGEKLELAGGFRLVLCEGSPVPVDSDSAPFNWLEMIRDGCPVYVVTPDAQPLWEDLTQQERIRVTNGVEELLQAQRPDWVEIQSTKNVECKYRVYDDGRSKFRRSSKDPGEWSESAHFTKWTLDDPDRQLVLAARAERDKKWGKA